MVSIDQAEASSLPARRRQLNVPHALRWHTQIVLAALHSGSFGFPLTAGLRWSETENQTDNPVWCCRPLREFSPSLHTQGTVSLTVVSLAVPPFSWVIQNNSWMERHSDCTGYLFQDEDRRMASVHARKEEEKKRENHKQTIHKVPLCSDLFLLSLSAGILSLNLQKIRDDGLYIRP